jgi:hypothetical protein
MEDSKFIFKMSIVWGTVAVLIVVAFLTMGIIVSNPRGHGGRITCAMTGQNDYTTTITCTTEPSR